LAALNNERREHLGAQYPGVVVASEPIGGADAIIAVKPQYVEEVAGDLARRGCARMLSIAAGVTIAAIESAAPNAAVVRCMPNTPALVGCCASAIAGGAKSSDADLAWAEKILGSVGIVVRLDVADRLARQTLLGAATLLHESGEDPAVLRENVTSPGGTTAAGLAVFADANLIGLVGDVVDAAVQRSIELGKN